MKTINEIKNEYDVWAEKLKTAQNSGRSKNDFSVEVAQYGMMQAKIDAMKCLMGHLSMDQIIEIGQFLQPKRKADENDRDC